MTKMIVLAADGSEHSDRALQWYRDFLHREENMVHIVTSTEIPMYMAKNKPLFEEDRRKWEQMMGDYKEKGKRVLEKYADECKQNQINYTPHLEDGSPGDAILRVATEVKASYIVIGSRGCGALHNAFLGSCSDHVVHHAHHAKSAVVVVPPAKKNKRHAHGKEKAGNE